MSLERELSIEDVVDCEVIFIEHAFSAKYKEIQGKECTSLNFYEMNSHQHMQTVESVNQNAIDLTGDEFDHAISEDDFVEKSTCICTKTTFSENVDQAIPSGTIKKVSNENLDDVAHARSETLVGESISPQIPEPKLEQNVSHISYDRHHDVNSQKDADLQNSTKRSSVEDILREKYRNVGVIEIGDSDDDSESDCFIQDFDPKKTDCIEILSDNDDVTNVKSNKINTKDIRRFSETKSKREIVQTFKRRRQESKAAFAKVSSSLPRKIPAITKAHQKNHASPYDGTSYNPAPFSFSEHVKRKRSRSMKDSYNESAYEEQERLFRESRARVKAQEMAQIKLMQSIEGSQFFSHPVADVSSLPPNHWKWSDPYCRLGVPRLCSIDVAKRNYRKLCLVYHPDKAKGDFSLQFQAIKEAWELISNSSI